MRARRRSALASVLPLACVLGAIGTSSCTARVIDVYISTDPDGTRKTEKGEGQELITFEANVRALYCIAEISNGREDATILGVLHQQRVDNADGTSSADRDIIVAAVDQLAPVGTQQKVSMALVPKNAAGEADDTVPLSGGVYYCEFALRTSPVPAGTKPKADDFVQFLVKPTACPPTQIITGQECNFFGEGAVCQADGARTERPNAGGLCTCTIGSWVCDPNAAPPPPPAP